MKLKQIRRRHGDVIAIPLYSGGFGYGRILKGGEIAFYNCRSPHLMTAEEVVSHPIIFILCVDNEYLKDGSWPIIGHVPLSDDLKKPRPYFIWESFQKQPFVICGNNGEMIPSTATECQGMERAVVWSPDGVKVRLQDCLEGRQEECVESVKPSAHP